jgi:hypothetical protein
MPEVVADPLYSPVITCFREPESKNLDSLLLISFARDAWGR